MSLFGLILFVRLGFLRSCAIDLEQSRNRPRVSITEDRHFVEGSGFGEMSWNAFLARQSRLSRSDIHCHKAVWLSARSGEEANHSDYVTERVLLVDGVEVLHSPKLY